MTFSELCLQVTINYNERVKVVETYECCKDIADYRLLLIL